MIRRSLTVYLFIFYSSLQAAYNPLRYKEVIAQNKEQLISLQRAYEEKIRHLEQSRAYIVRKQQERKGIAFQQRVAPVFETTTATLQEIQAENRALQRTIQRLNEYLSPRNLSSLTDEHLEEKALTKLQQELAIESLQREAARATFAQNFFETQKKFHGPQTSQGLESLRRNWDRRRDTINSQLRREQAALRSVT